MNATVRTDMKNAGLMDPDVIENPFAYYAAMRNGPALSRDPGTGFWVAWRHDVVRAILRDNENFSARLHQPDKRPGGVPQRVQDILATGIPPAHTIHTNDPPDHTRYRKLVDGVFSNARVRQMENYIARIVDDLLDGMMDRTEVELIRSFCAPVPLAVIADVFGVDRAMIPTLKEWSDRYSEMRGMMISDARLEENAQIVVTAQRYFAERRAERRIHRRDDLLSDLVHATLDEQGSRLTEPELNSITFQFLVAGNETSTSTIAECVRLLAENPALQKRLRDDPTEIPPFIEEVLRLATPVQGVLRMAVRDVTVEDTVIPAGSLVHIRLGSANRDGAAFSDPDAVDPARRNLSSHLGFGAGVHFCIGAAVARAEVRLALTGLLRRTRDIRLMPGMNDLRHHPIFHLRGLMKLHVGYDAVRP